jgi:very-short-patch-repair endonuclease
MKDKLQTPEIFREKQRTLFPRKRKLADKITPSEQIFMDRLDQLGIRYMFQKGFIAGDFYCIVDFYIPKPHKICIEIDGPYHNTPEQKRKDWAKDKYLVSRKTRVVRIKNEDATTFDIQSLLS